MAEKTTDAAKKKTAAEILRERKINAYQEQISQYTEQAGLLNREQESLVCENILGLSVSHKQFGMGQVTGQDDLTVSVQFSDSTRRFPIPQAFLKEFLQTEDDAVALRFRRYREIGVQLAEIRQEIAAAERAIRLLKK